MKENLTIRKKAKESGVRLWEIADQLGVQESLHPSRQILMMPMRTICGM